MKGTVPEQRRTPVSGAMMSYYLVCHTKLWLAAHHIGMERWNRDVRIGREVQDASYRDSRKDVRLPGMKIPLIKNGDALELRQIKKSSRMVFADRYQAIFYLSELRNRGLDIEAVVEYPMLRETLHLNPTEEDLARIEEMKEDIRSIINGPFPEPEKKRICARCAYRAFCFGGSV